MTTPQDTIQVIATINLYATALDTHRYDLLERVFADDACTDFGGGAAFEERESLVEAFKTIHAPFHATQHIVSGHSVTVEADTAYCMSYVQAYFTRHVEGVLCVFEFSGWYDDQLVRQADGWRIRNCVSRMVTANGDHRVMQAMPGIDVDFRLLSLSEEAAAGRIAFLQHV